MRRGFLNTEKAKLKLAVDAEAPSDHPPPKDKGKVKTEIPEDVIGPHPPLLDLHSGPPVLKNPASKNRFIFLYWPRDPNGKTIVPSDIRGKEAGNGLDLWGATLYDFYHVRRIPDNPHCLSISTGSRLTKIMEAFGELQHAQHAIAWASREADPKEIPGWDPAEAITIHEHRVHAGYDTVGKTNRKGSTPAEVSVTGPEGDVQILEVSEPATEQGTKAEDAVEVAKDPASESGANEPSGKSTDSVDEADGPPRSEMPVESPFHPSHYPSPWPLVPFESSCSPFVLQRALPIHLLPKKLYVHDPWKLAKVSLRGSCEEEESWTSKTDYIRPYALSLPLTSQRMAEAASKEAAIAEDKAPHETVLIYPQETEGPTEQPAIRAFLPKQPRKLTEVPEAHLYLSPKKKLGTGNHSVVYAAELELPRDLFCESTYCESCLDEQVIIEVNHLKESGEWERCLSEAAKDYEGPGKRDTASQYSTLSPSAQISPRYVGFIKVRPEDEPVELVDIVATNTFGEPPPVDAAPRHSARLPNSVIERRISYQGLVVPVHPKIRWQNPSFPGTICEHQAEKKPVPRTARFTVAAKLSLPGDWHLEREASNYLSFPAHFFQHWTGYNVVPPLQDPTPIGALVPQFFGYYTPDTPSDSDGQDVYCSPILLMEQCGKPIRINKLSIDDRHECASLLLRFHHAGWLHESFAERNILMRKHHPTCVVPRKECQCETPHQHRCYSFRLIDFGRSVQRKTGGGRNGEETMAMRLLGIL